MSKENSQAGRLVIAVCNKCGSENCGHEAAVRWDALHQKWSVSTIYDKSAFCNDCGASDGAIEIQEMPIANDYERPFTIFVRQMDRRGTTHISVQRARNHVLAMLKAKEQASADWGNWSVENITGIGIIAGDVDVMAWDDETAHGAPPPRAGKYAALLKDIATWSDTDWSDVLHEAPDIAKRLHAALNRTISRKRD